MKKKLIALIAATPIALAACSTDADVASHNLGMAAENFEINRRIVFINGITDKYILEITGYCSVDTTDSKVAGTLEVTCKTSPTTYKKHFRGLSDNVTFLVEQIAPVEASPYNYRVVFKPDVIIPNIDVETQVTR